MKHIILFILLSTFTLQAKELSGTFQLIPRPQQIEVTGNKGISFHEVTYILTDSDSNMPVLSDILDQLPRYKKKGKGILLQLTNNGVPSSEEGYILEVNTQGVTIRAKTEAGLFYGCQTLAQLMEDSRDFDKEIPSLKITDYPAISFRAVHFDTKHHLSRMEYYYRCIDKLARYKINAVIWEIEDKLRFTRRPEIGSPNAISKQEMQALCRYAKERHIEINPLVQGLGHAGFILKHHWELRENPASDWEFCPSEPRTYELQFDLYKDAIEAMPYGKYLHIGGDEITAIGIDERCKATGKTAFELQMIWLKKVCDFAVQHGRIPIFWDDMPLKYGGVWNTILSDMPEEELAKKWNTEKLDKAISLFPKECIYMRWNYEDPDKPAHRKILEWYRDKGLKVMGATAASSGNSTFIPRENTKAGYIKNFCRLVAQNNLEGILATAWDDGSPHLETVWRGYIALGEYGWNPSACDVETFKAAHGQREYGFNAEDKRMAFVDELEKACYFFDNALIIKGSRNPAYQAKEFTLIELPDKKHPGEWSKKYADKIEQAKKEMPRYETFARLFVQRKNRLYVTGIRWKYMNKPTIYRTTLLACFWHSIPMIRQTEKKKEKRLLSGLKKYVIILSRCVLVWKKYIPKQGL